MPEAASGGGGGKLLWLSPSRGPVSHCTVPCCALDIFYFSSSSHFIDEEAEAQACHVTCPKSTQLLGTQVPT